MDALARMLGEGIGGSLGLVFLLGIFWVLWLPVWMAYFAWRIARDVRRVADALESAPLSRVDTDSSGLNEDAVQKSLRERGVIGSALGR